jgi:hypothetical protein
MTSRPRIRLIALDVDGTLLDDRKQLPPANREALRKAADRGVQVAIASGRMIPSIEPIERMLEIDCAIIAYNGGKVVSSRAEGRHCLQHLPLPAEFAEVLIRFSQEKDYLLNFYVDDVLYADDSPRRSEFMAIYSGRTGAQYRLTDLRGFVGSSPTKLILLAEPAERDRLYDEFLAKYGGEVNVTKSDPEYLEFMARGVDKGTALPVLAEHYGLKAEEVLAMGDADNDLLLLAEAGLGVAVANARDGVKAVARRVTSRTNNEGAVAEAVERWVLGNEEW